MSDSMISTLRNWHARAHNDILSLTESLSDEELTWQPHPNELPVVWHMWHIARFADVTQSAFGDTEQFWDRDQIAARWGFLPAELGIMGLGTDMDQEYSTSIKWPDGKEVRSYVESTFKAAIDSTSNVTEANFDERVPRIEDVPGIILTFGNILTRFVWHPGRHMGAIETLISARERIPALK